MAPRNKHIRSWLLCSAGIDYEDTASRKWPEWQGKALFQDGARRLGFTDTILGANVRSAYR